MHAFRDYLERFGLGHATSPWVVRVVVFGQRLSTPPPAGVSVVGAIDGFNRLWRFVQHAGQRCNDHAAGGEVDGLDDLPDGGDEDFAPRAVDDVDVVGAGLEDFDERAEGFAGSGHHGEADEFVDEVGLGVVAEDVAVERFEEFAVEVFDLGAGFEAGELDDPVIAGLAGALDDAADAADVDRAAALDVAGGRREDLDPELAAEGVGPEDAGDGGKARPGFGGQRDRVARARGTGGTGRGRLAQWPISRLTRTSSRTAATLARARREVAMRPPLPMTLP